MSDFIDPGDIKVIFKFLMAYATFSLVGMVPVWCLWNWLCPSLFDLPSVTLMEAWGLTALCSVLFKSVGPIG